MIWNPFRRRRDRRDTPGNAGPASDSTAPATATEEAPPPAGPAAAAAGATTPDTADAPAPTVPDRPVGQIEHDIINVLRTIYDPEVP
ncbi:MAG: hypothetical protein PVF43_11085, partial [Candidatus Eiseniibacteriota bacterium]